MEEPNRFIEILRRHFPDATIQEWEEYFVHEYMDDEGQLGVVSINEQIEALSSLERHLHLAMQAYGKLHPHIRHVLDRKFGDNTVARTHTAPGTTLAVRGDRVGRTRYLSNYFLTMLYSLTGLAPQGWRDAAKLAGVPLERQESAIDAAKLKAKGMRFLTGKAANEQTWKKIALVERALICWRRYGTSPARLNSQAFQAFLQDLSDAVDVNRERGWDAADIVATYRRRSNLS
ncbi:hypothetical protein [Paracoccus yeei]|jgi:hypothetical protein|uniref:hypothetical protein n=1 Tax=Paracoccus yeei TaxID=147645 RepID=UPI003BF81498